MRKFISQVRSLRLRQIAAFFVATLAFFTVAAFSQPAQALPFLDNDNTEQVDAATVKRIQQKAEDFGGDDIGDTGLENIRELPENIPETTKLIIDQRSEGVEEAAETAKEKVEETVENAKDAID